MDISPVGTPHAAPQSRGSYLSRQLFMMMGKTTMVVVNHENLPIPSCTFALVNIVKLYKVIGIRCLEIRTKSARNRLSPCCGKAVDPRPEKKKNVLSKWRPQEPLG